MDRLFLICPLFPFDWMRKENERVEYEGENVMENKCERK